MRTVSCNDSDWTLGDLLFEGGMGKIYEVIDHDDLVAKVIPRMRGADRELLFVDLADISHVIEIKDYGETTSEIILVLPRAEVSLEDYLTSLTDALPLSEATSILTDLARTLVDLDEKGIVHRDIKPANILKYDGHWCLADFGIARFAEAATAANTMKRWMSPHYAAPEQWNLQRATNATDVYALGVVGFQLVSGALPFQGDDDDLRDQHLHAAPPAIDGPAGLTGLIHECLYKAPGARPSPTNLHARLIQYANSGESTALARLQEANASLVLQRSTELAAAAQASSAKQTRRELFDAAFPQLCQIYERLRDDILSVASEAHLGGDPELEWTITLGSATLSVDLPSAPFESSGMDDVFDVVAVGSIRLDMTTAPSGYRGRSHSLWFADAQEAEHYAWFETAFMESPLLGSSGNNRGEPFDLHPSGGAAAALRPAIGTMQVAWPFTPLTTGNLDDFIERWATWLALGSTNQLQRPSSMPERPPQGSWRRDS